MDRKLTLNDGTELEDSYALNSGSNLWIYVYGNYSMETVFNLLNDSAKTSVIESEQYGDTKTYTGFTELFCIRKEEGGFISAGLRKSNAA